MTRSTIRRVFAGWVISTASLAGWVSGCATEEKSAEQLSIQLERITETRQYLGPAQQKLLSPEESRRLLLAYDTVLAECVEKEGEVLSIDSDKRPPWLQELVTPMFAAQPLGPVSARRVAQFGFHDPQATIGSETVEFVGRPTSQAVLERCVGPTGEYFGGPPPAGVSELIFAASKAAGADSRLAAAQERWSSCMQERGYDYELPTRAQREYTATSEITAVEIDVATASVMCQAKSRNIDTYVALVVAHESQLMEEHAELFAEFAEWRLQALRTAAQVIAEKAAPPNRSVVPAPSLGMAPSGVG